MRPLAPYEKPFAQYPLLRLLLPWAAGMAAAWMAGGTWPAWAPWGVWAAAVAGVALLCVRRRSGRGFFVLTQAVMALLGAGWMMLAGWPRPVAWPPAELTARGVIMTHAAASARTWRTRVRVVGGEADGRVIALTLQRPERAARCPRPGDGVAFRAAVTPPRGSGNPDAFDYGAYLRRQGVSGTAFADAASWRVLPAAAARTLREELPPCPRLQLWGLGLQQRLAARFYALLPHSDAALMAALALGDRSQLPREVSRQFALSGVSHVLALSGMHLTLLVGLFLCFCPARPAVRAGYYGAVALVVWTYTLLAGMPASLVRAAGMTTFLLVARTGNRHARMLQGLFAVTFVMLLLSPATLVDVGFQLSFVAVLFIGLFMPPLQQRLARLPWGVRQVGVMFCLSLVAQAGTLPLVLYYFHQLPVYFLLANLLIVPLSSLMIYGAAVFVALPLPGVDAACAGVLHMMVRGLLAAVRLVAGLPGAGAVFYVDVVAACGLMAVAYGLMRLWAGRRFTRQVAVCCVAGVAAAAGSAAVAARPARIRPQVVFYNAYTGTPVHFMVSARTSYLLNVLPADSALLRRVADTYWQRRGIRRPVVADAARCRQPYLASRHGVVRFQGHTYVLLPPGPTLPVRAAGRLTVCEVLFVSRGSRVAPELALRRFCPRRVVLDAGLPAWRRRQWAAVCRRRGLTCHDVAGQGALVLPCQSEQERFSMCR